MIAESLFESIAEALEERLDAGGLRHSLATAETAERLARVYDVDVEQSRVAGLAHDWARSLSHEELLGEAESRNIPITEVDREVPYLLHAPVGARQFAERFPSAGDAVFDAIRCHTVGAADMSPLQMIIYLADMLEPARTFPGVDELRDAVGEVDLDELFRRAYMRSFTHIVEGRRYLHPATVGVWNARVAGERQ